jgi:non-canonical (house-cleaning) NTP pyrophosphatase
VSRKTTTTKGQTMTTTTNHGAIRATGRTVEMTVSEYRQAITGKYARLPRRPTMAEVSANETIRAAVGRAASAALSAPGMSLRLRLRAVGA